ncbi:thiamine pyrophosphate-dependent enzyme [Sphingomonas sp.]|uniref:thiamine pyrophosphate-dependent enzyme n=1 Tax=Sphingomonas sp. TaxID=28214 RepID=UPI003D6CEE3E
MTDKTAAQAMVDALIVNGVDTVFGLPGAQMYPLFDALYDADHSIRTIGARHEQGLAYMAFGYARSSGRLGVYSPVPGPGVLNATAAMCTSLGACAPTLCLTGEIPSMFKGMGRGHLHELPDQLGILKRLTHYAQHIETPADTPAAMTAAISGAMSGRKGPAALSICWDHLGMRADMADAARVSAPAAPAPDDDALTACVRLIRAARRPIIFTGSGAQDAAPEIGLLAEALNAPVVGFRGGRGVVGEDRPLGLSMAAAWTLWAECDLMIGIGTRLEIPFMRWGGMMQYNRSLPGRKLIRIDIDPAEMDRLDTDGPLVADAAAGASALVHALVATGHTPQGDLEQIAAAKAKAARDIRSVQPQMDYLDAIRDVLPRDGFLVEELSQMGFTSNFGFPVYAPRTYVSCGYQGTLGFGFPTALGVKVAHPDKAVVSVTGDGGFQFALPELATAVQHGINLVTIVFDNGCYGNVLRDQETRFNNHVIGADLVNPDFVKLADSYGIRSWVVDSPSEMRPALEAALALGAPALIQVRVARGSEVSPWSFISPQ